jgi:hypothetical protein
MCCLCRAAPCAATAVVCWLMWCVIPGCVRCRRSNVRRVRISRARDVTVGLSNEQVIEIVSGLDPQACVYIEGVDQRFTFFTSPPRTR